MSVEQRRTDADLQRRWEERASTKGATLSSVLYRGFTDTLNGYVHDWHVWAVCEQLLPRLPQNAVVLDLGCGYGRIRQAAVARRPDLRVVGMDFSETYCRLYVETQRADAVCADMRRLPFVDGCFDGLIAVTCLMYLDRAERASHIAKLLRALKPSGHALFVDPGLEFMRLARVGFKSARNTPTGGEGFPLSEYCTLGEGTAHRVYAVGAMPAFTMLLPALYAARRSAAISSRLLKLARRTDLGTKSFSKYSLQRWALLGPRGGS